MPTFQAQSRARLVHYLLRRFLARDSLFSLEQFGAAGVSRFVHQFQRSAPVVRFGLFGTLFVAALTPMPALRIAPIAGLIRLLRSAVEPHRGADFTASSIAPAAGDRENVAAPIVVGATDFDEIVVGSGPGGAVAALLAAKAGRRVLVLESGTSVSSSPSHSVPQLLSDFRFAGQQVVLGSPLVPFAEGSVLGGGSEVNSGLYHRIPPHILGEWLVSIEATIGEWETAVADVERQLPILSQGEDALGIYANSPIPQIAAILGWRAAVVPRWRSYEGSSYRHYGMRNTYLREAELKGAIVVGDAKVERIALASDKSFVEVATGRRSFRGERLVLSAGTTATPEILARSGIFPLRRSSFGFHLMSKVAVRFPFAINDFVDIDPHQAWQAGESAKIGVSASTPEILRSTFAGLGIDTSGVDENCGVYYVSIPATGRGGLIRVGQSTQPWFRLDSEAKREIEMRTAHLESAVRAIGGEVLAPGRRTYSTVHVFGSLPIGTSDVCDSSGNVRGANGRIRLSDASVLPTAPSVNPQGPLMHLASLLAQRAA